jgi:hypothetical protein
MRVKLNEKQRQTLLGYLSTYDRDKPKATELTIEDGQLAVDGMYIHSDGEWATYPEVKSS